MVLGGQEAQSRIQPSIQSPAVRNSRCCCMQTEQACCDIDQML